MISRSLFFFLLLLMPVSSSSQKLQDYRWKYRILLLCEKGEDLSQCRKQIEMFSPYSIEMEERQLLILITDGETLRDKHLNLLNQNIDRRIRDGFEGVLLLGKDGGTKLETDFFVDPATIFKMIDSMPMRRAEMRRKGNP